MSDQLDQKQIELLEETFAKLVDKGERMVEKFYSELFLRYPDVKPMFADVDQKEQEKKLLSGLALVINNIRKPEALGPALTNLGKSHQKYGAVAEHYPAVAETLLDVMSEFAGDLWTDDVKQAWTNALNTVATAMLEAYEDSEDGPMSDETENEINELKSQLEVVKSTLQGAQTPLITIDRDFNINYANDATVKLLQKYEAEFKAVWPSFDANNVMGVCIDMFHKNPEHQRKLLADPSNLPYMTDISIGDLKFKLVVSAQMDLDGNYIGTTLEWEDVTELRQREDEQTRLQIAIDASQSPMIMIDRDFIITYMNDSTKALLEKYESKFAEVWPGFEAKNAMGVCIDMFHKNPEHQRKLLADPDNLPYQTDIEINGLKFSLNVIAQMDARGNYIGNTLEWADVTELRQREQAQARLQVAVDGAQSPMIMIDRDFVITYVNDSTMALLEKYESKFAEVWPGFEAKNAMGVCIDMFHKNPAHQRKLLDDPNNLPYTTDISIGDLKFKLVVSAQMDLDGNYIGTTLEWEDVTAIRQRDLEVARLQSAVDGAQANLMLCDEDLNITYANPSVVEMLRRRQNELRAIWPSLNVDKLVGENIDQFHKNPAHQRRLLGDVTSLPANAEIKVGELEFGVNATAITDAEGNYMGNMVEWKDITEEKDAERQIEKLITSASAGELDSRLDAESYSGFMNRLASSINNLMDAVVEPINESTRVIESLSDGDLTQTMDGEFDGQFLNMQNAVNSSIGNLMKMVGEINENASSISTSANEIAQGNLNLSQRTEEQASSLEETASSVEEMTGTVKQNADNAQQANQLAESARTEAEKGGSVVSDAIAAMGEINQASKKIADIIGVIDEIAFQTNLLALNAAVEAARAGEQGRGFAVVAAEVRNLAQRSAGAAKEIKTLINDSVQKVDEGSRLVDESGSTLEEIVNSVQKVNDIIAEIAAASSEQSTGIEQINKTISQMDEMTQQNASLVEEAAAASESMDEQSKGLTELIGFFNTGEGSTAGANAGHNSERRSNERPWKGDKPQSKPASKAEKKAASAGGDSEWEEF